MAFLVRLCTAVVSGIWRNNPSEDTMASSTEACTCLLLLPAPVTEVSEPMPISCNEWLYDRSHGVNCVPKHLHNASTGSEAVHVHVHLSQEQGSSADEQDSEDGAVHSSLDAASSSLAVPVEPGPVPIRSQGDAPPLIPSVAPQVLGLASQTGSEAAQDTGTATTSHDASASTEPPLGGLINQMPQSSCCSSQAAFTQSGVAAEDVTANTPTITTPPTPAVCKASSEPASSAPSIAVPDAQAASSSSATSSAAASPVHIVHNQAAQEEAQTLPAASREPVCATQTASASPVSAPPGIHAAGEGTHRAQPEPCSTSQSGTVPVKETLKTEEKLEVLPDYNVIEQPTHGGKVLFDHTDRDSKGPKQRRRFNPLFEPASHSPHTSLARFAFSSPEPAEDTASDGTAVTEQTPPLTSSLDTQSLDSQDLSGSDALLAAQPAVTASSDESSSTGQTFQPQPHTLSPAAPAGCTVSSVTAQASQGPLLGSSTDSGDGSTEGEIQDSVPAADKAPGMPAAVPFMSATSSDSSPAGQQAARNDTTAADQPPQIFSQNVGNPDTEERTVGADEAGSERTVTATAAKVPLMPAEATTEAAGMRSDTAAPPTTGASTATAPGFSMAEVMEMLRAEFKQVRTCFCCKTPRKLSVHFAFVRQPVTNLSFNSSRHRLCSISSPEHLQSPLPVG